MVERIGHRGARGLFPENTIAGFRLAAPLVDRIELDIGLTADDVVVVSHDPAPNPNFSRDLDGAWLTGKPPLLRQLTAIQLARLDVGRIRPGSPYAALFPDQSPIDGARVPTLADVLAALPTMPFTLELKTFPEQPDRTASPAHMAERVLAEIQSANASARITVQSFDWRGPRHLRSRPRPDYRLSWAWLTSPATIAAAALWWDGPTPMDFGGSVARAVAAVGGAGDTWSPWFEDLTPDQIAEAHGLNLRVVPWTVNRRQDIDRLIGWGVDGIITDRPDRFPVNPNRSSEPESSPAPRPG